jgi:hypothetical protein
MALNTGEIILHYPLTHPDIYDESSTIGGNVDTSIIVNSSSTGLFATGLSTVAGGANYVRYAKVFVTNTGLSDLVNPVMYITNQTLSNQIEIAADPYFTGAHTASTGTSSNRAALPDKLLAVDFSGYTATNALDFSNLGSTGVTMAANSANSIGIWIRMTVQAGLPSSTLNTFSLGVRGEAV